MWKNVVKKRKENTQQVCKVGHSLKEGIYATFSSKSPHLMHFWWNYYTYWERTLSTDHQPGKSCLAVISTRAPKSIRNDIHSSSNRTFWPNRLVQSLLLILHVFFDNGRVSVSPVFIWAKSLRAIEGTLISRQTTGLPLIRVLCLHFFSIIYYRRHIYLIQEMSP